MYFIVNKVYISKKTTVNKHSSLLNGRLAKILTEMHLMSAIYHKTHQGIRGIQGWIEEWTHGYLHDKGSTLKWLQQNQGGKSVY